MGEINKQKNLIKQVVKGIHIIESCAILQNMIKGSQSINLAFEIFKETIFIIVYVIAIFGKQIWPNMLN